RKIFSAAWVTQAGWTCRTASRGASPEVVSANVPSPIQRSARRRLAILLSLDRQYLAAGQVGRLELVDDHGCVFSANGWGTCSGRGTNPVVASCFFFSAFPR